HGYFLEIIKLLYVKLNKILHSRKHDLPYKFVVFVLDQKFCKGGKVRIGIRFLIEVMLDDICIKIVGLSKLFRQMGQHLIKIICSDQLPAKLIATTIIHGDIAQRMCLLMQYISVEITAVRTRA